jgi:hypothetical protein
MFRIPLVDVQESRAAADRTGETGRNLQQTPPGRGGMKSGDPTGRFFLHDRAADDLSAIGTATDSTSGASAAAA